MQSRAPSRLLKFAPIVCASLLTCLLAACGGGGGGADPLPVAEPVSSPTAVGGVPVVASAAPTPSSASTAGLATSAPFSFGASPPPGASSSPGASFSPGASPSTAPTVAVSIAPLITPLPFPTWIPTPRSTTVAPSSAFTWTVGAELTVPASVPGGGIDAGSRGNFPDAHFSVLPDIGGGAFAMYWGVGNGWRSTGSTAFAEAQIGSMNTLYTASHPSTPVASDPWQWASYANWIVSVNRVGATPNLIAFVYGDDLSLGPHYQNTGVTYSSDNGMTWSAGTRLFSAYGATPPPGYANTGPGDENGIVVRDFIKNRWFAITPEWTDASETSMGVMRAQSTDPNAAPGTWRKFYNGSYSSPAMGGPATMLSINNMWNPTLFWDTYLGEWVYISDDIAGRLYLMTSKTLDDWTGSPRVFLADASHWYQYPTAIGVDDKVAGRTFVLYYANFTAYPAGRSLRYRTITFNRTD